MKVSDSIERGSSASCARHKNVYERRTPRVVPVKPSRRPLKLCVPWTFPTWSPWTTRWTANWFTDDGPHGVRTLRRLIVLEDAGATGLQILAAQTAQALPSVRVGYS